MTITATAASRPASSPCKPTSPGSTQTTVTADNFADFTAANNIVSVSGTQNVALTAQNDIITGSSGDDTITLTTQGAASGDTVESRR